MLLTQFIVHCLTSFKLCLSQIFSHDHESSCEEVTCPGTNSSLNDIPFSTRAHWIRVANQAPVDLVSPCSFGAFGAAIVNHTANAGLGELICLGANNISATGNPTLHGEIAAIDNCTAILTNPTGPYKYNASETSTAWQALTLYPNAESWPMCASAIRWAGFKEYVYGTTIDTLIAVGWSQIAISSCHVFRESLSLGTTTAYLGGVLENETDPSFLWQFSTTYPCPEGCTRDAKGGCSPG